MDEALTSLLPFMMIVCTASRASERATEWRDASEVFVTTTLVFGRFDCWIVSYRRRRSSGFDIEGDAWRWVWCRMAGIFGLEVVKREDFERRKEEIFEVVAGL
jgi:hypothetical protein